MVLYDAAVYVRQRNVICKVGTCAEFEDSAPLVVSQSCPILHLSSMLLAADASLGPQSTWNSTMQESLLAM